METKTRPTLRDLPLPAKLVVTVFLITVGLGYFWGLMQMHFKHASRGNLVPTVNDAVERFSGQRPPWEKEEAAPVEVKPVEKSAPRMVAGAKIQSIINARCVVCHGPYGEKEEIPLTKFDEIKRLLDSPPEKGKLHKVISKDDEEKFAKDNMTQAFTRKSTVKIGEEQLDWKDFVKAHKEKEPEVRAERETERLALKSWLEAGAPEEAYTKDAFPLPADLVGKPLTNEFKVPAAELQKGAVEVAAGIPNGKKKKNPKDRQLSVESLTQSTHAHLLSFAMLWAITGLVFAFTTYSVRMRVCIAPIVLVAQVADICCWWLARLPDVGPYFAIAVMGTGAIVGLGLAVQVVLSLFNMYGRKGKIVLLLLALTFGAGGGIVFAKYVQPHVAAEKEG